MSKELDAVYSFVNDRPGSELSTIVDGVAIDGRKLPRSITILQLVQLEYAKRIVREKGQYFPANGYVSPRIAEILSNERYAPVLTYIHMHGPVESSVIVLSAHKSRREAEYTLKVLEEHKLIVKTRIDNETQWNVTQFYRSIIEKQQDKSQL